MDFREFDIPGPKLIVPKRFSDARGFFSETFSTRAFGEIGIDQQFVQDNHAFSIAQGTVRGLHFQAPPYAQAKLIRVTRGRILDVAVDIRRGSPSYGQHIAVELSADNWAQLFVPQGLCAWLLHPRFRLRDRLQGDGFLCADADGGILWNDPALGIAWPDNAGSVVSDKDNDLPCLKNFTTPFPA